MLIIAKLIYAKPISDTYPQWFRYPIDVKHRASDSCLMCDYARVINFCIIIIIINKPLNGIHFNFH